MHGLATSWNNYDTHSNSTIRLWDKFDKHSLVFAVVGWVGFEHKIEPSGPVPRSLKFHPPISSSPVCSQEPKYWNRGSQPPEESEERTSLGRLYTSHLEGQNAKEEGRDVQVKRKGDIQIKYPSLLHSMHRTNSASRINGRMTLLSQLAAHSTTSNKTLMGWEYKGRSLTVQVEGWDAPQIDI